jgi:hypothetical protein
MRKGFLYSLGVERGGVNSAPEDSGGDLEIEFEDS